MEDAFGAVEFPRGGLAGGGGGRDDDVDAGNFFFQHAHERFGGGGFADGDGVNPDARRGTGRGGAVGDVPQFLAPGGALFAFDESAPEKIGNQQQAGEEVQDIQQPRRAAVGFDRKVMR